MSNLRENLPSPDPWGKKVLYWLKCTYINAVHDNDDVRFMIEFLINILKGTISNSRINHSALAYRSVRKRGPSDRNKSDQKHPTRLTNKRKHLKSDGSLRETGTSMRKEAFHLLLERRVLMNIVKSRIIFHDEILCQIRLQAPSPFSKPAGIVWVGSMSSIK